jgi:peptidoglycan/LPS O-acetylase OafA/YrhL
MNQIAALEAKPRLEYLDSLRGLAATWVVFFHMIFLAQPNLPAPKGLEFLKVGGMGVTLFFIISAFSMCLTMPRHIQTGRSFFSFYVSRFFRIVPLFWSMLVFSTLFLIIRGFKVTPGQFIINLGIVYNFFPGEQESLVMAGWTIGVEVLFYLIFPFIYLKINSLRKNRLLATVLVFIAFYILGVWTKGAIDPLFYKWSILRHAPVFFGGMVFFYLVEIIGQANKKNKIILAIILYIFSILTFNLIGQMSKSIFLDYYGQLLPFGSLLVASALLPLPLIVSKITSYLGKISYSLYLAHPVVIVFVMHLYPKMYGLGLRGFYGFCLCSLITLGTAIVVATILYNLIEKPAIAFGKSIIMSRTKKHV